MRFFVSREEYLVPRVLLVFSLWSLVFGLFLTPSYAKITIKREKNIAAGVGYAEYSKKFPGRRSVAIHVITADLNSPRIQIKLALAKGSVGRLETVKRINIRNNSIAAVNGTFFDRSWPYLPIGLIVIDGNFITKSSLNRSAIGLSKDNGTKFGIPKFLGYVANIKTKEKISIWGINRPRKEDEVIIYTPEYGLKTKTNDSGIELIIEDDTVVEISSGNSEIPKNGYVISFHGWTKNYANALPPGARIEANIRLSQGWENFDQVITGGPRLIEDGRIVTSQSIKHENFRSDLLLKNARTAIGVTEKKKLLLVVIEGRTYKKWVKRYKRYRIRRIRTGLTFKELAEVMKDLGCRNAIALDGGGASTMCVKGKVVNLPSDGYQQSVSNAIIVKARKYP